MTDFTQLLNVFEIAMSPVSHPELHTHLNDEFFLCLAGEGWQHTAQKVTPMQKGDLFLFPEGQLHIGSGSRRAPCLGGVLNVKAELLPSLEGGDEAAQALAGLRRRAMAGDHRIPLSPAGAAAVQERFREMIAENRHKRVGYRCALVAGVQRLLLAVIREGRLPLPREGSPSRVDGRQRIAEVVRFLKTHFMYPVTIEQLTRMANLSRSHFHTLFRQVTGQTLVRHVNRLRIEHATRLLAEKGASTRRAAESSGFQSLSHFYYVLRRTTRRQPRDFRAAAGARR